MGLSMRAPSHRACQGEDALATALPWFLAVWLGCMVQSVVQPSTSVEVALLSVLCQHGALRLWSFCCPFCGHGCAFALRSMAIQSQTFQRSDVVRCQTAGADFIVIHHTRSTNNVAEWQFMVVFEGMSLQRPCTSWPCASWLSCNGKPITVLAP